MAFGCGVSGAVRHSRVPAEGHIGAEREPLPLCSFCGRPNVQGYRAVDRRRSRLAEQRPRWCPVLERHLRLPDHRLVAARRRHGLHPLDGVHQHPGLRPRDLGGARPLRQPERRRRGQPLSGALHRPLGDRRPGQHRWRGAGNHARRTRSDGLDDPGRPHRDEQQVHRVHARPDVPQGRCRGARIRRPDALPARRPRRARHGRIRQGPRDDLRRALHRRVARRRQHVPGQPVDGRRSPDDALDRRVQLGLRADPRSRGRRRDHRRDQKNRAHRPRRSFPSCVSSTWVHRSS